ncbi:3b96a49c-e85e-42cb-91ed-fb2d24d32b9b-CDS [Sclerotinia trifoliorum]|uniref:3b96a49c-e85e-42cb-91ed-fb2d24d32b9b-CDS n=1 Tax=Sclerotinia trifoliorum TaxID=28548 RepID=A0A8H2VLI8_9HELO|nr:3b96a49c-e85e-42cb-91ed-fb2d24d32b9b-CDS [Sclerotinia trifoliorum]
MQVPTRSHYTLQACSKMLPYQSTKIWLANRRKVKVTNTPDEYYKVQKIQFFWTAHISSERQAAISLSTTPWAILLYNYGEKRLARIFMATERHLHVKCAQQHRSKGFCFGSQDK